MANSERCHKREFSVIEYEVIRMEVSDSFDNRRTHIVGYPRPVGRVTIEGCQHNFVCSEGVGMTRRQIGQKYTSKLGVDYSIPGAKKHHPIAPVT